MRETEKNEKLIVTTLTPIAAGCFAAMIALTLGGCAEDGEPVPQENPDGDLVVDPDNGGAKPVARPADDGGTDPNPAIDVQSQASLIATPGVSRYDRNKALEYVRRYALTPNPQIAYCSGRDFRTQKRIGEDCTNFASQVLWHGGLAMDFSHLADSGWWYTRSCEWWGSSKSWRSVEGLLTYLVTTSRRGELRKRARDLQIGDLVFYRLRRAADGHACKGGPFNHTTVVSGFDEDGEPLVSYHSNEAEDVRWNTRNGSRKALGEACMTAFVHIKD